MRDEELRKRLGIESFDEILDRMRMDGMEKIAKMPATSDDSRLPRKLVGACCFGGKKRSGGQLKALRKSYLDLLRKLQFDHLMRLPQSFKKYHGTDLQWGCCIVEFNLRETIVF